MKNSKNDKFKSCNLVKFTTKQPRYPLETMLYITTKESEKVTESQL